jgi:hypothetical protein
LQQQVTFAHIPEVLTAIPILVHSDLGPSTSGRAASAEEEEEAEEEEREEETGAFDYRTLTREIAEQAARLADSDDSSGYSPSPDHTDMPLQPINLLDQLNLGGASRAPPTVRSTQLPQSSSPSFADRQREKRPAESPPQIQPLPQRRRTGDTSLPVSGSPPLVQPWAPTLARPDGTLVNAIDKISSTDVAFGISRAALLPNDMEREKGNSYEVLMKSIFQSSAKVNSSLSLPPIVLRLSLMLMLRFVFFVLS